MRLSIIIPVYNVARYLPACVESVLRQEDFRDYEIILVDDGSTDGESGPLCDRIAERNPDRIRVIHQANRGLGGARNTGLEAASGEYVLFLDSDDTLTPDALTQLNAAMNSGAEIIAFYMQNVTEDGKLLEVEMHHVPADAPVTLAQYPALLLDTPSACARLWRRSLFCRTGIRFPDKLRFEDLYTTGKLLLEAESILGLDKVLYLYLHRDGSIMRGKDPSYNTEVLTALDSVLHWFRQKGQHDAFRTELEAMILLHTYYAAFRILRLRPDSPALQQVLNYLCQNAPGYRTNPYYKTMSLAQRVTLRLLRRRLYSLAAGIFDLKDRLKGLRG